MKEAQDRAETKVQNCHTGHRQRMQECFLRNGIDGFSDVEVLEYLLTFALPRVDTNPLAHRLLDEFGSLYRVFEAPVLQLRRVDGVGLRTASLIRFVAELWNRSEQSRFRGELYFHTTKSVGAFLVARMAAYREERAFLMCLDSKCKLLDFRELARGAVNQINLPLRKVVEAALAANATSVILAHNHPNGTTIPSVEDVAYTRELMNTLRIVDVILVDHFIVTERSYLSMKYSRMLE